MGYKQYAVITPRLYAMKTRFLTRQKIIELAHAEGLDDLLNSLKDTRYGGSDFKVNNFDELSKRISKIINSEIDFLRKITPSKAKEIINTIIDWEEEKELLSMIMKVKMEKEKKEEYISWSNMVNEFLEKVSLGLITIDFSPQGIKRIIEAIPDARVRKQWSSYLKYYEEEGSLYLFEVASFISFLNRIKEHMENLDRKEKKELEKQLCPVIDYYVMLYAYNLIKKRGKLGYEEIISEMKGCRLDGTMIKKTIEYGGLPQLYEKIMEAYRIPFNKITDEFSGDVGYRVGLRKLLRKLVEQAFLGFPFTPRLPVAVFQWLLLEKEDLMVIIAGKISRAKPEDIVGSLSVV